jgi:hypothetical protein
MKHLKLALSIIMLCAIAILSYQFISDSIENQKKKSEYAELNHFKYGLFSVDAWKSQLSVIITDEIDKIYLTRRNKSALKSHLEVQLEVLIDKVFERIKLKNQDSQLKQSIMDSFVDVADIKKGIPDYAQAILAEMTSSKTESQIKSLLKERIQQYVSKSFDTKDVSRKQQIIQESGLGIEADANRNLEQDVIAYNKSLYQKACILLVLAILLFVMEGFSSVPLVPSQYLILCSVLVLLGVVGVTTPMIDMEAKISNLTFVLLDHPILFDNQILYFQSKTILDVFWIMITHKDIQMKFVGLLVVGFSVVFPLLKLISSYFYYFNFLKLRNSKLVQFFVLQSGKWSMADVLVVAIFMAYIGFNGIVSSQLGNLAAFAPNLELITTNGTSLQPGYYLFLAYTILAMFLSSFLKKRVSTVL